MLTQLGEAHGCGCTPTGEVGDLRLGDRDRLVEVFDGHRRDCAIATGANASSHKMLSLSVGAVAKLAEAISLHFRGLRSLPC